MSVKRIDCKELDAFYLYLLIVLIQKYRGMLVFFYRHSIDENARLADDGRSRRGRERSRCGQISIMPRSPLFQVQLAICGQFDWQIPLGPILSKTVSGLRNSECVYSSLAGTCGRDSEVGMGNRYTG